MEKVLVFILSLLFIAAGPLNAASKSDLEELRRKAQEKEEQLRKYKAQESRLAGELNTLTKKEKQAELLSIRLSGDIKVFQTRRSKSLEHKALIEENLPMWQHVLAQESANYVIENMLASRYYESREITDEIVYAALLRTHMIFLKKLDSEVRETKEKIENFQEKNQQLLAQKDKVESQKESIKDNYQKKKEDLATAHELYEKAAKELKDLKASAEDLQNILKAAEVKRKAAAKKAGTTAAKAELGIRKNSLPWPVSGKIISSFGKEYQPQLKTWIFRDGIKIIARKDAPVLGVAEGSVIFAGEFRSYGNVVIVDHNGGFFTIYGFLSEIRVRQGQSVRAGQILGISGMDTQGAAMGSGENAVYFEIRAGTTASDPEIWLESK